MRIEDAWEIVAPTVLWSLPVVLLSGAAPAWWSAAAVGVVILGASTLVVLRTRTPANPAVARQAMIVR